MACDSGASTCPGVGFTNGRLFEAFFSGARRDETHDPWGVNMWEHVGTCGNMWEHVGIRKGIGFQN